MEERRSRAVLADLPDGDAEAASLVGEIGLDAAARGDQHADRQCLQYGVVPFERSCLALRPVGLKGDLRHLAVIRPDAMHSAPLGLPPCKSTMSGCLTRTWSSLSQI